MREECLSDLSDGVDGASDSLERLLLLPEMRWSEEDERLDGALLWLLLLWRELRWRVEDSEDEEPLDTESEEYGLLDEEEEEEVPPPELRW